MTQSLTVNKMAKITDPDRLPILGNHTAVRADKWSSKANQWCGFQELLVRHLQSSGGVAVSLGALVYYSRLVLVTPAHRTRFLATELLKRCQTRLKMGIRLHQCGK